MAGAALKLHQIAEHRFYTDLELRGLEPFATDGGPAEDLPAKPSIQDRHSRQVFRGTSLVAGLSRQVECRWGSAGYELGIRDVGVFHLTPDGQSIRLAHRALSCSDDALFHVFLGPVLILAMAMRGAFSLHASSVCRDGKAILFLGPSSAGKSTLARTLASLPEQGWRRLADDILPVTLGQEPTVPVCRSGYPQPKLAAAEQPFLNEAPEVPVADAYVLNSVDAATTKKVAEKVSLQSLDGTASVLALIQHTVGSRLFAPPLLASHLSFCTELARRVRVRRLHYPREAAAVAAVAQLLSSELQ